MSDIASRLRDEQARNQRLLDTKELNARRARTVKQRAKMAQRAADEIERLTAEVTRKQGLIDRVFGLANHSSLDCITCAAIADEITVSGKPDPYEESMQRSSDNRRAFYDEGRDDTPDGRQEQNDG